MLYYFIEDIPTFPINFNADFVQNAGHARNSCVLCNPNELLPSIQN